MPGPTQDPQKYPYDRAMYFNLLNRNKRDLVVDLSTEEGKQIFLELMREADVFVENNSARVMPNLGPGLSDGPQGEPGADLRLDVGIRRDRSLA